MDSLCIFFFKRGGFFDVVVQRREREESRMTPGILVLEAEGMEVPSTGRGN